MALTRIMTGSALVATSSMIGTTPIVDSVNLTCTMEDNSPRVTDERYHYYVMRAIVTEGRYRVKSTNATSTFAPSTAPRPNPGLRREVL